MLMLVLFSTFLMHSIFPHVHHSHEDVSIVEHHHHHDSDSHSHSDDESHSEDNDSDGFLDFLLGHHSHSNFNSDFTTEKTRSIQKKVDTKKTVNLQPNNNHSVLTLVSKEKETPPKYRAVKPENLFLLNCSLRGPPSLG